MDEALLLVGAFLTAWAVLGTLFGERAAKVTQASRELEREARQAAANAAIPEAEEVITVSSPVESSQRAA